MLVKFVIFFVIGVIIGRILECIIKSYLIEYKSFVETTREEVLVTGKYKEGATCNTILYYNGKSMRSTDCNMYSFAKVNEKIFIDIKSTYFNGRCLQQDLRALELSEYNSIYNKEDYKMYEEE